MKEAVGFVCYPTSLLGQCEGRIRTSSSGRGVGGRRRPRPAAGGGGGPRRAGECLHTGAGGGGCSGRGSIGGRGGARAGRGGGAGARREPVRLGAASARSSPAPGVRRAGVSPRAPGGGGEPRAARARASSPPAAPRLRPLFLWASQRGGTLHVRCEDYDPRNRITLARTPAGWRAFPRTETFDRIRRGAAPLDPADADWPPESECPPTEPECSKPKSECPPPAAGRPRPRAPPRRPRARHDRRPRRRRRAPRRATPAPATAPASVPAPEPAWLEPAEQPDLESHIPTHKIEVLRVPQSPAPAAPSPPPITPPVTPPGTPPVTPPATPPGTPHRSPPASPPRSPPVSPPRSPAASSPRLPPVTPPRSPPRTPTPKTASSPRPPPAQSPPPAPVPPAPPEPTPLDNLLAVAELEFNQQRGSDLELELRATFPPAGEGAAGSALRFELAGAESADELGAHDDLFETISSAHYLPELGQHDEALLESLVEKGCEDNQILGRIDRLAAQLARHAGEYESGSRAPLAGAGAAVHRLDSLGSPSRTAAQGLLHLHRLPRRAPDSASRSATEAERADAPPDTVSSGIIYDEHLPDLPEAFDYEDYEDIAHPTQVTESGPPEPPPNIKDEAESKTDGIVDLGDINMLASEMAGIEFKLDVADIMGPLKKEAPVEVATDLRAVLEIDSDPTPPPPVTELPAPDEPFTVIGNGPVDKSEELPRDLSMHRRLSTPYASPRRIEIPRAPSRESDAMQSPQPSGIPAISSPEVFNTPTSKCKQPSFLEALYASTSPKMYTSEVTITKQQCEPLNLGKHRKSASPTVSSCSDELRNINRESGEPQEKRMRKESHDLANICNMLKKCGENKLAMANKKKAPKPTEIEQMTPMQQLQLLQSNKNFNLPNPLLVPKDRVSKIIESPGKEIPALLMERPQLSLPEILRNPSLMTDPDLIVLSLDQLAHILLANTFKPGPVTAIEDIFHDPREYAQYINDSANNRLTPKHSENNQPTSSAKITGHHHTSSSTKHSENRPSSSGKTSENQPSSTAKHSELNQPSSSGKHSENPSSSAKSSEHNHPSSSAKHLEHNQPSSSVKHSEHNQPSSSAKSSEHNQPSSSDRTPTPSTSTPQPDQTGQPRPIPSMGHLADDIDAANSAAAYQMLWLPAYLNHLSQVSQLEAAAACSQNAEFVKALHSSGAYPGANYANLSQMFHPARFMNPGNFPMMPPMDYDGRMQLAMWQEAVNASAAAAAARQKQSSGRSSSDAHLKDVSPQPSEFQNPYAHFAKSHQNKPHSSARTSPIANNYTNNQRTMAHNHFMQTMYPGMGPNLRPNVPLPNLQIPYFNPGAGSQKSPRTGQQKSPTSPYYPNNNYLHSKQADAHQRCASGGSGQGSPRPRISVKSLQELQQSALAAAVPGRRASAAHASPAAALRRREEPEVGSTTAEGPPLMPPLMPPLPHDPAAFPIWNPLFSNQKGYTSPWSWTTVTATGD